MNAAIKLRVAELDIYGREEELSVLKKCYHRVESCGGADAAGGGGGAGSLEVVLVSGGAGTGKSSLVRKFREEASPKCFFVSGKFDDPRATTGQPYGPLRVAFRELVDDIMESCDETERKRMGKEINDAVGSDGVEVLDKIVPGIQKLYHDEERDENDGSADGSSDGDAGRPSVDALNRLMFAARSFLRSVCSQSHPVVLFLDDLQWVDQASLKLIESIVTDTQLRHLLFVGAYRDEEVDEATHPLALMIRETQEEKLLKPIWGISIKNLDVTTVTRLVSGLLRRDDADVLELSEIVHQRTGGNAFFVLQFLYTLQKQGLLLYDLVRYEWTWDTEKIRAETDISENVVEFVAQKIQRLPSRVATVLKVMACFPSTKISIGFLGTLLKGLDMEEFQDDKEAPGLVAVLEEASDEGLVDKIGSESYKFTHDRVREGAYVLIPAGPERDTFHLRIGELVLEMLATAAPGEKLWMEFVAADQLNHGIDYITSEKQKFDLVSLNLDVGQSAMAISAFVRAAEFFEKGLVLLRADKEHWKRNYDLSLKLHSSAVETAYCTGDFERHRQMVGEVLMNAVYLRDKLPVYCSLVESLQAQQKLEKAMNAGFHVLARLGQYFPRGFISMQVRSDFQKTKNLLQGYSDEDLVSLPPLGDEQTLFAIRIMSSLVQCTYFLQRREAMVLLVLRQLRLMVLFGANEDTPYTFACYGMLLCGGLGDIKEGCRYGNLALRLLEVYNDQEARVRLVVHLFVVHWQSPVPDQIDPLVRGYRIGMASGDVANAFLCAVGYSYFFYHAGLPLKTFVKDTSAYCQQMQEYKQDLAYMEVAPLLQGALNLMGQSEDPLVLSGEAIIQDEFLRDTKERCIPSATQKVFLLRMQLAYYFGDIDLAFEMMESCNKLMATMTAHMIYEVYTFFCGLIYLEKARRTKKRKYRGKANNIIAKMKKWAHNRGVNSIHKLWLLEAEYTTLNTRQKGQRYKIKSTFDSAISVAARSGFLHDAALANERAGIWFRTLGDDFWASSYLLRAHELYREWGADAKAKHLNSQYNLGFGLLESEALGPGRSAKGKSRFDVRSSQQHRRKSLSQLSSGDLSSAVTSSPRMLDIKRRGSERNYARTTSQRHVRSSSM